MLTIVSWHIRKDRPVLLFYLVSTFVQLALICFALKAYVIRYLGVLFITLVIALWLHGSRKRGKATRDTANTVCSNSAMSAGLVDRAFKPTIAFILIAQVVAGAWAYAFDLGSRFSNSEALAEYVASTGLHRSHTLVGFMDCHTQCIIAENRVPMYFPQISDFGHFAEQYNKDRKPVVGFEDLVAQIQKLLDSQQKPVALVLSTPLTDPAGNQVGPAGALLNDSLQIRLLHAIDQPVISRDEVFWIYEVTKR
jgi:hypothetical protein